MGKFAPAAATTARIILGIAVLVGVWALLTTLFSPPAYLLPGPQRVFSVLVGRAGYLLGHAGITLIEILLGLGLGAVLGVITALAMNRLPRAGRLVMPLVIASQALPVFAIAPLLVIWLGYGLASKIAMATLIIYFPVVSAFHDGLNRTDAGLIDLAHLSGATPGQTLRLIRVPAALPSLVSGLRLAAAVAPIGAVVGEWVGASKGLGFVMVQANARMQTDIVFAALFLLVVMALAVRFAVEAATRRLVPWMPENR
ncbi:MAG: ABC transporter permease [Hyphomicrobiales bacterium]|nr:MAG: ABC transporter permease [Hyphomicrobiales bacterium]